MYNNYLFLLRGLIELKKILLNNDLVEIYTQEKDKLFLRIYTENLPDFTLIFSTLAQEPYISYKSEFKKAKRNTKNFFNEYLPEKLLDISIAETDRIIQLNLKHIRIYFLIRGQQSNVIAISSSKIHSFKKLELNKENEIKSEICKTEFLSPEESFIRIRDDINTLTKDELINKYRFLAPLLNIVIPQSNDNWKTKLVEIINEIVFNEITVTTVNESGGLDFLPSALVNKVQPHNYAFTNYFEALHKFLVAKRVNKKDLSIKNRLDKYLRNEIKKISNKLNNLKTRIEIGSKEDVYSLQANLLLMNINKLRKGQDSITVYNEINNTDVTIALDKALLPNQNIDRLFEKAKAEKINFQKSIYLYSNLKSQFDRLTEMQQKLGTLEDYKDILLIQHELGIKSNMELRRQEPESNFRRFLIDNKYHLFVGKNSKNNEELTTKFAKQNDLWFHARSVSGSHVVLRIENIKEQVPKNIIKKAASIAAFYSKAKTSKLVSVSYTFKKYVIKKKNLDPGQVILLREQVILVPPEIPGGCNPVE